MFGLVRLKASILNFDYEVCMVVLSFNTSFAIIRQIFKEGYIHSVEWKKGFCWLGKGFEV